MDCKGCTYEGTDSIMCEKAKLKEEWNNLMKEIPVMRRFVEDFSCPYREDGYELVAQKEKDRNG